MTQLLNTCTCKKFLKNAFFVSTPVTGNLFYVGKWFAKFCFHEKKTPFALWNIGNHPKSIYSGRPYLWNAERLSINDYIHVNLINLMFYWIFSWISEKFDFCWQWYKDHRNICENINDFQVIIHDMQIFSCVSWDYWVLNCYVQYSE